MMNEEQQKKKSVSVNIDIFDQVKQLYTVQNKLNKSCLKLQI